MENMKYRYIYEYEFYRGTSAVETARRINGMYGAGVAKENTVRLWFPRFRSGIVEAEPSQTTTELATGFGFLKEMPFKRVWDATCPRIYDEWESNGEKWVIQDLLPEHDKEAVTLMMDQLLPDSVMSQLSGINEEKESKENMRIYYTHYLSKRMSLACYHFKDGKRTLAAVNCCFVKFADENEVIPGLSEGAAWRNVQGTLGAFNSRLNAFEYLNTDKLLYAVGLIVRRDYRGANLGSKMLAARGPLCKPHGIPCTSTLFSGIAAQKNAARAGFTEVLTLTLRELADAGLNYPRDDDRCMKLMVKKFE